VTKYTIRSWVIPETFQWRGFLLVPCTSQQ